MVEFKESKFYKLLQDFFINNNKETFLQMLGEFYNRTEGIIEKNVNQDELIKELRELYLEFNEKGIDENIVREKVNYFVENNGKIKDILAKLIINTNKIEDNTEKLNANTNSIENINSQLDTIIRQRELIEVNLNDFSLIAKHGTSDEDWTLAFNHVFSNVIKNNCGVIKWNGQLKIKSTINLPYGVSLCGTSLPYSGLIPTEDFNGDYCIQQTSKEAHVDIRNIYIAFELNPLVGGIYLENPYDYSTLDNIVGTITRREFIRIGSETGSRIGQTIRIENCICYGNNENRIAPLVTIYNHQEAYLCNNKFMHNGKVTNQWECFRGDGITNSTFINNSFTNTNGNGISIGATKYPKRISGNTFIGNLFENILCGNNGVIRISSNSGTDNEGYENAFYNNVYLNSDDSLMFENIANTIVIGKGRIIGTSRRNFQLNPITNDASEPYGNTIISADGSTLGLNGDLELKGNGNGIKLKDPNGNKYKITVNTLGQLMVTPI